LFEQRKALVDLPSAQSLGGTRPLCARFCVMVDEVLDEAADVEKLSFYGLVHCLGEVDKLIDRADQALLMEKPSQSDQDVADRKDEILEVQGRLRRAMGALLEKPSLTKREKPLAENFLQKQLSKLEKSAASGRADVEDKAARAIERLRRMLDDVRNKPAVAESASVRKIQAELASAEAEWKDVSPIYEKWEKGKHSFKTADDLMAMRRRYENCRKTRESAPDRLEQALRAAREGKVIFQRDLEAPSVPKGWAAVAKKAPSAPPAASRTGGVRKARAPAAKPSSWGAGFMSLAQRLRAEASAQVREQARANEEEQDDGEDDAPDATESPAPQGDDDDVDEPTERPPPPPVPRKAAAAKSSVRAKPPPPLPVTEVDSDEEVDEPPARPTASSGPTYTASAKKKGKGSKKKKGGGAGDGAADDDLAAAPETSETKASGVAVQAAAWATQAQAAISGSILQELLSPSAVSWRPPDSEESAEERLAELSERLPWSSLLGLVLPLSWTEFASLEVDGGPRRTSKRGSPQWIQRVQKNIAWLLAHYITIVFFVTILHALSHFGLLLWVSAAQVALILAPPSPYLPGPNRVLLLQGVHLVLWLLYVRSLWQMHFIIKCLAVLLITGHAYVVAPPGEN